MRGQYCRCLEKKLPSMHEGKQRLSLMPSFESFEGETNFLAPARAVSPIPWTSGSEGNEADFTAMLKKAGLADYEIELLVGRFIYLCTANMMVKNFGWQTKDSVNYLIRKALIKLKQIGFKP